MRKRLFLFAFVSSLAFLGKAQAPLKYDTAYYEKYTSQLVVTPFLVKNLGAFSLGTPGIKDKIRYYANAPVGIGLRVGYDWLSLAASYGIGAIDPDYNKAKGKTKTLNLNTTFAARSFLVDVFYQNHKGMYMRANALPPYTSDLFYVRPDVHSRLLGVSGLYVFNGKKFSARPAFKYDTWQKKSAGSLLAGLEFFTGFSKGDSSLVPSAYAKMYPQTDINKMQYLLFGPGLGYGHTFVVKKHLFVNAIGVVNGDISKTKEYKISNTKPNERWDFEPNLNLRGGLGYNTPRWEIAFSYFTKRLYLNGETNKSRYLANSNDYRLSFTKRLNAGKTVPKVVGWAGNIIEKLGLGFLIR